MELNTDTGQIVDWTDLTESQKKIGKWIPINDDEKKYLDGLNRKQRREWLKKNRKFKDGKWGFIQP